MYIIRITLEPLCSKFPNFLPTYAKVSNKIGTVLSLTPSLYMAG